MAAYTTLTPFEVRSLLSNYNLGKLADFIPMEGGQANSSIKIKTEKGVFILSVCDEKNDQEIRMLTCLLADLESRDFPTTRPVRTKTGDFLISHEGKPVYVKEFIHGQVIQFLSNDMVCQVGEIMATLHKMTPVKGIPEQFPYGIESFDDVLERGSQHSYIVWLEEKKKFLEQSLDPNMEKGFIHGDIFWDNLVFSQGTLTAVLDFEEACYYYRLFDLGMCSVGCCSLNGFIDMEKVKALLKGYQKNTPLIKNEKVQFKHFLEYAAVAGSFWRFRQYNIKHPDPNKVDTYLEFSALADQIHTMGQTEFMNYL